MFSRIASFAILALPVLAAATPAPVVARNDIECCDSTIPATSDAGVAILKGLGIVLEDVNVLLGLNCSPITVIGVGSGDTCTSSPVSCTSHSGLIGIGCVPVTA